MFSRGLSVAIPTVCRTFKGCFRRNHHRIYSSFPCRILMIPVGNIMPGDTCPWVSLRSTHGYKSDHPLRGCRHIYVIARPSTVPSPTCTPHTHKQCRGEWKLARPSTTRPHKHPTNAPPHKQCRGDWKVARNTRNASISLPGTQQYHNVTQRGRASTRPYTACISLHVHATPHHRMRFPAIAPQPANAPTLHVWTIINNALQITPTLHRVAVGASGSSPATHAQRKRDLSPEGIIHV